MKKVAGIALLVVLLAACSDDNSSTRDGEASPSPTPTPGVPTPTPTPGVPTPTPTPVDYGEKGACLDAVDGGLATTSVEVGPGCIGCAVSDADAVLSESTEDMAVVSALVGVLPAGGMSDVSLVINLGRVLNPAVAPTPTPAPSADPVGGVAVPDPNDSLNPPAVVHAPSAPGFTVSFPDSSAVSLGVLPDLVVDTLLNGVVVNTASFPFGLLEESVALGLIGVDINNAQVYLPVDATGPYDALRIGLTAVAANALLNINVHNACGYGVAGSIVGDF